MKLTMNSTTVSSRESNEQDRIRGRQDLVEAFRLTWQRQRGHLFTSWIHVPMGVMFLLVVTWGLRLAIDLAPFRFPAPVIAMLLFFVGLLLLDWLSTSFPGRKSEDTEKAQSSSSSERGTRRKRFVDPIMALLAPPCEFLLRNMTVMFTPSFILIPAREIIPGKEIGLITVWFLISQVLAFIFPVLFLWAMDWSVRKCSRKPHSIPIGGRAIKTENGGTLATGLSVMTASVMAPVSHFSKEIDADGWRQIESTVFELARQQGDPAVIGNLISGYTYRNQLHRSDVSSFRHHHRQAHSRPRPKRSMTSPAGLTVPEKAQDEFPSIESTIAVARDDTAMAEVESEMQTRVNSRNPSRRNSKAILDLNSSIELMKEMSDQGKEQEEIRKVNIRPDAEEVNEEPNVDIEEDDESAIERLSSWISDLITPVIYFILFIIGIPLYFQFDIALPLFLGINILTFIAAITIVPPKIRRFLHPILSCSIASVFIIWAFGAMRGVGLKNNLNRFYSVDARYSDLWNPSGYRGPVPGAGDVLFSTLDAGIVALAVPMYRYRAELKANFVKMIIVLTFCAALSLFLWNSIAALMGMDESRSLAFTARFMSTPLAIELAGNIGADESITVILVVLTGILAAILKDHFFRFMKVDREDHLIVGITMGSTAGAIGASSLIGTPKVMAVASLSFVIFGSILLIATAIPPVVDIVHMLG